MRLTMAAAFLLPLAAAVASFGFTPQAPQIAKDAEKVLKDRCFVCHGLNGQTLSEGVFVNSRAALVKSGKLIAGDINCKIIKLVDSGAMPPPNKVGDKLSAPEIEILKNWVKAGAPDWTAGAPAPSKRTFFKEPDLVHLIANDLEGAPERDRKYLRYYSIAHLYNSDVPDEELEGYRLGLSKLLNSLSWAQDIHVPVPIGSAKVILRIDLRDYDWSAETWAGIISYYPYGYKSTGSDRITSLSGAVAPYVRADWFVEKGSLPPLYHDILRLPDNVSGLEALLKVDVARRIDEEKKVARGGMRTSGVSQNNRVVERHVTDYGAYWKSYDFSASDGEQNIFINPLDLKPAGGEMIFNLPNGMQAYYVAGKNGQRLNSAPPEIVSDRNQPDNPIVRTGRSCMSCHYAGIKDFRDGVREVVSKLTNASYDLTKTLAIYREQPELNRLVKIDSSRFASAVASAGGSLSAGASTEPINSLSRKFEGELSVKQAAAEAGLSVSEMQKRINGSDRLKNLGYAQLLVEDGGMKRDAWESYFGDLVAEASLGSYLKPIPFPTDAPPPVKVVRGGGVNPKPIGGARPANPKAGDIWINPKDGAELIYVAAGNFQMGDKDQSDNKPHQVLLGGYWIYKNVVTVAQYKKFCADSGHALPPEPSWGLIDDHPVVNVSAIDAQAYCKWAGIRLPSEEEWEKAAAWDYKNNQKLLFPWGNEFDGNKCWSFVDSKKPRTNPAGTIEAGASPYGLLDMAGNVWQWTSSNYDSAHRVLRGGSWSSNLPDYFRSAYRFRFAPGNRGDYIGFRGAAGP